MERIFYSTDVRDPITNYPLYIFDTSYLPPTDVIDYNELISTLLQRLPLKPYVLVMFSSGLNKISWVWGLKFIKTFMLIDNDSGYNLKNLVKIFLVHDSWFIKSITSVLHNYNYTKKNLVNLNKLLDTFVLDPTTQVKQSIQSTQLAESAGLIGSANVAVSMPASMPVSISESNGGSNRQTIVIHCSKLSQLSEYLDITKLKISLNIYKYNMQLEESILLSMKVTPIINPYVTLSPQNHTLFYHHLYQIFNIINSNCYKLEFVFYKPGKKANIAILYDCLCRNQVIWINDWDLYSITTVFKRILLELPHPLLPWEQLRLPLGDDLEYTKNALLRITESHKHSLQTENYDQFLIQFFDCLHLLLVYRETTKHTPATISKSVVYCLSHKASSDVKETQILQQFIENVMNHWQQLKDFFDYPSVEQIIYENEQDSNSNNDSSNAKENAYDTTYEMTFEDESNDDETRIAFNTNTILKEDISLRVEENREETDVIPNNNASLLTKDLTLDQKTQHPNRHDSRTAHNYNDEDVYQPPLPERRSRSTSPSKKPPVPKRRLAKDPDPMSLPPLAPPAAPQLPARRESEAESATSSISTTLLPPIPRKQRERSLSPKKTESPRIAQAEFASEGNNHNKTKVAGSHVKDDLSFLNKKPVGEDEKVEKQEDQKQQQLKVNSPDSSNDENSMILPSMDKNERSSIASTAEPVTNNNTTDSLGKENIHISTNILKSKDTLTSTSASTSALLSKSQKYTKNQTLSNVSNLQLQFPPQKYQFTTTTASKNLQSKSNFNIKPIAGNSPNEQSDAHCNSQENESSGVTVKKPVIRGRKVSQLAKLFEERCEGMQILQSM